MKIMAVDYGDARTGLAVCDRTEMLASPVGVVEERDFSALATKVAYMAIEYDVKEIIVGLPKNMDGSSGNRAQKCELFVEEIAKFTEIPIKLWDERRTTIEATNILNVTNTRGKKRKATIDAVAATLILEGYLRFRENESAKTPPAPPQLM